MLKRLYAMVLAMVLSVSAMGATVVYAAEEGAQVEAELVTTDDAQETETEEAPADDTDVIDAAKNGVVQINCVYVDKDGNATIYKGSSGILIGNSEKEEYVITSLERMNPTDEEKNKFLAACGVKADDRENANLSYEVVIENDITATASMVNSSVDLDMAVFKLSQIMFNRTPMKFIYSENGDKNAYNSVDTAYALGFPTPIESGENAVYYSNDRVNKIVGQISNVVSEGDIQFLEHKAEITDSNVGGPLITPEGEIIGMNSLRTDGNYYYAVSSNTLVKALTGMGIPFDSVTFEDKAAAAEEAAKKNAPKESSQETVIEVHTETPKWVIPVIIALAVVLIIAIVVVIILLVKNLKAGKATKEETNAANSAPQPYQFQPSVPADFAGEASSDTTVLGAASTPVSSMTGMNMAAPSGQLNGGILERKKNGENISIMKNSFCLGKDDLHCDYCIRDNNTISRQHAIISVVGNSVYIEDNHSKNGTFLNGIMLVAGQRQELRDGDVIKLSNEEFVYKKQ